MDPQENLDQLNQRMAAAEETIEQLKIGQRDLVNHTGAPLSNEAQGIQESQVGYQETPSG